VAARATADRMLFVSFSTCAAPALSPATVSVLPHSAISGRTVSTVAGSPETMTDSVPARAPGGPPEIGQSTTVTPRAFIACSTSFTKGTPTVQVLTSTFMALPWISPSSPNATARNAAKVGRETNTVSHRSARSRGDAARLAWRSSKGRMAASLMS